MAKRMLFELSSEHDTVIGVLELDALTLRRLAGAIWAALGVKLPQGQEFAWITLYDSFDTYDSIDDEELAQETYDDGYAFAEDEPEGKRVRMGDTFLHVDAEGGFWWEARPKHAGEAMESRLFSLETLE